MKAKPILATLSTVLLALACLLDQTAHVWAQAAVPAVFLPLFRRPAV